MVLKVKTDDEVLLQLVKETDNGVIVENKQKEIQREIKYILQKKKDYPPERYTVLILFHNELPENYIFQIYEKSIDQRIGWIFPIQALLSNNHSYAKDEHFLKVAYPAFINLISSQNIQPQKIPDLKDEMSLEDFYLNNSIILILDNEELKNIKEFNFEDYMPNLYQYGYFVKPNKIKLHKNVLDEFFEDVSSKKVHKRLTISSISVNLKKDVFINQLFKEQLSDESHKIIIFYLLYQIIELLIKRVFDDQFKKKIKVISLENVNLFDLNKKLQEMTSEKKRIKSLLNEYSNSKSIELEELLFEFLQIPEEEKKDYNLADLIYEVRTFLVHSYRRITNKQKILMEDINFYFERIIIYLLINYKED